MERIASFCVDHTTLTRGVYLSRQDGDVNTWDLRMKEPNKGDYLTTGAMHTLEHLFATYARNSQYGQGVIYVGPMGCRTGFYILVRDTLSPADPIRLVRDSLAFIASYEGEIPGAARVECGNYLDHDLAAAKRDVLPRLEVLQDYPEERLKYRT